MQASQPERPEPAGQQIIEESIGERLDGSPLPDRYAGKNPAAVALGKLGGAKGGATRAASGRGFFVYCQCWDSHGSAVYYFWRHRSGYVLITSLPSLPLIPPGEGNRVCEAAAQYKGGKFSSGHVSGLLANGTAENISLAEVEFTFARKGRDACALHLFDESGLCRRWRFDIVRRRFYLPGIYSYGRCRMDRAGSRGNGAALKSLRLQARYAFSQSSIEDDASAHPLLPT